MIPKVSTIYTIHTLNMHTLANLNQLITFIARYLLRNPHEIIITLKYSIPLKVDHLFRKNEMNSFHQSQLYFSI